MKKWFGILLTTIIIVLTLALVVACDPKEPAPVDPGKSKFTITFDSKGGDPVEPISAEEGSDISELLPEDPTNFNLFFGGWSLEDNGFASKKAELPTTMPSEDVTYYARWVRHAIVVPMLQPLDADGMPDADRTHYVPSNDDALTIEVNPSNPVLDLYAAGNRPTVTGFNDVSTAEEHSVTVEFREKTVQLYYDRAPYNVSFNLNSSSFTGNMDGERLYFGQTFELPAISNDIDVPLNLRFAGWATDTIGSGFVPYGEEITVGETGGLIPSDSTSAILYAVYDKGYFDFAGGGDYLFLPEHEPGVAIVRRVGVVELKGEYLANGARDEISPQLGEFFVENSAGTELNGYVYEDGHFAYRQNNLDTALRGSSYVAFSIDNGELLEGSSLTIVDLYGGATLTLAEQLSVRVVDSSYSVVNVTLEPGTYSGGYWQSPGITSDFCFSLMRNVDGSDLQVDMHFNFVTLRDVDEPAIALRGSEAGLFCEDITEDGYIDGDLVLLDGYGNAMIVVGNSQYEGTYVAINETDYLVTGQADSGDIYESIIHPDFTLVYGENSQGMYVIPYEKGDSSLYAYCQNDDGSKFEADGFGTASYTDSEGNVVSGDVELGAPLFESTSPSAIYKLTSGATVYSIIVDQFSQNGNFVAVRGEAELVYLFNSAKVADNYVGAIIVADGGKAYFLTLVQGNAGNYMFADIVEGEVSTNDGFVFRGGQYVISYAQDEELTDRFDIPSVRCDQIDLGELTLTLKDIEGNAAGTLTLSGGKATYAATGADGFANADYLFAYSAVIVPSEGNRMFIVDSFKDKTAMLPLVTEWHSANDGEVGKLYEYNDGSDRMAVIWVNDMSGEAHFFAFARVTDAPQSATKPLSGEKVYLVSSPEGSFYAIKHNGAYLAPSSSLLSGTYALENGKDELVLDAYGFAKYRAATSASGDAEPSFAETDGEYRYVDGVFEATFGENAFKFTVASGRRFAKVDYKEFMVVNPMTLRYAYLLRVTGSNATLYSLVSRGGSIYLDSQTSPIRGTVGEAENGIYTFSSASGVTFSFYYNDTIFVEKVVIRNNDSLPEGTFEEEGAKSITLDKFGRASYDDGNGNESEGYYYSDGGMFRYNSFDGDTTLRFSLDVEGSKLLIFNPNQKPADHVVCDITYEGESYKLDVNTVEMKASLLSAQDSQPIVTGDLRVDEDGIYTFAAATADNSKYYNIKFILRGSKLVQYDQSLDYSLEIITGNIYLYEQGINHVDGNRVARVAGTLIVKGFSEVAEIVNVGGTTLKGSVSTADNGDIVFTADDGDYQAFAKRTYDNQDYLAAYGTEQGGAINFYNVLSTSTQTPVIYFDGLGRAYDVAVYSDGTYDVTTQIGYYYFGANPLDPDDSDTYIIVAAPSDGVLEMVTMFAAYSLSATATDGSTTYVTGVMEYDDGKNAIALADDGSLFLFNGFDQVTFFDGEGKQHRGYFNNYGEAAFGEADNRYIIMDDNENLTLFFVYFDDETDENGFVRARRGSYALFTPSEDVYFELQLVYEEDFAAMSPGEQFEDGATGYAILLLEINGEDGYYTGFFTIEGGVMIIEAEQTNAAGKRNIEIALYTDGSAEWLNMDEWLEMA